MKTATLIYNSNAGNGAYSEKELVALIEANGYKCRHLSTKGKWKDSFTEADLIVVAGGDGTLRKVIKKLLESGKGSEFPPIAVLPLGTANNIIKALNKKRTVEGIISSWRRAKIERHDVGMIEGVSKPFFFLESFGFGLFPSMMKKMKKNKDDSEKAPDQKLKEAQQVFSQCVNEAKPEKCHLKVNGKDYSGKYLAVEIMNTSSIGPNLRLAPAADMADGKLDIVLIGKKNEKQLTGYLLQKRKRKEETFPVPSVKAKKIVIRWNGKQAHADGELVKLHRYKKIKITIREKVLKFLI